METSAPPPLSSIWQRPHYLANVTEIDAFNAHPISPWPSSPLFENLDRSLLSDDEKIELSRLAEIVDLGGDVTALSVNEFARARDIVNKGRGKDITPKA